MQLIEQKVLFEIRFGVSAKMFHAGADMADEWLELGCELAANSAQPVFQVTNQEQFLRVAFSLNSATVTQEGDINLPTLLKHVEKLGASVVRYGPHSGIERLGLRSRFLTSPYPYADALAKVSDIYATGINRWNGPAGRDVLADMGIVLKLKSTSPYEDMVMFGPYDPEANRHMFDFANHPVLKNTTDGFIFDVDHGTGPHPFTITGRTDIRQWVKDARELNVSRASAVLSSLGLEVEG